MKTGVGEDEMTKDLNVLKGGYLDNDGFVYEYEYDKSLNHLVYSVTDKKGNTSDFEITDEKIIKKFLNYFSNPSYKSSRLKFLKENVKNYVTSHIPSSKNNRFFIDINNIPRKNTTDYIKYIVESMPKKFLIEELKRNGLKDSYYENLTEKQLRSLVADSRIKDKSWKYSDDFTGKSRAFKDLFSAVEANNLLKKYFNETSIVDKNNVKLHPVVINKINSHNRLINEIKTTIINGLITGNSVLLKSRNSIDGIDYSYNTATKKPFEDIQQLYMQQIRKNKSFKSPYFMPSSDVIKNGFTIKEKSLASITSHINKSNSQIEFSYFYNGDQLEKNNKTLDMAQSLVNSQLEVPYVKRQDNQNIVFLPPVKSYDAKSFLLIENFKVHMSNYFKSIYTDDIYIPPVYSTEEINAITSYINNSMFFKDVKESHDAIKNSLLTPVKQKRHDHSRRR